MFRTISAITLLGLASIPGPAEASPVTPREIREKKVTACSKYNFNCYTATLVKSTVGWMVRLKGGNRLHCGVTCEDTLRRATVDFWEDLRERSR
jgi:hypothetical protein